MRILAVPIALVLLAGCFSDAPVAPASTADENVGNGSAGPSAGICVIGVDSPCNAPRWRDANVSGAPRAVLPVPRIVVNPAVPEMGREAEIEAVVDGVPDAALSAVVWDFGDGSTGAGREVRHAWQTGGLYTVAVTVAGNGETARASAVVPVKLNLTWTGMLVVGDGGPCVQPGTTCAEHAFDLAPGAQRLVVSVVSATGALFSVQVVTPEQQMAGDAASVSVDAPSAGTWMLTVRGVGANADYTLNAVAEYAAA